MHSVISRAQFERLVLLRLDRVRPGVAREAKWLFDVAWETVIDHIYEQHAERLRANEFPSVVNYSVGIIIELVQNARSGATLVQ